MAPDVPVLIQVVVKKVTCFVINSRFMKLNIHLSNKKAES